MANFTRCKICTDRSDNNYPITENILGKDLPDVIEHISGIQISTLNVAKVKICQTCAVALIQAESVVEKLRRSLSNVTKKKLHPGKQNVPLSASQKKESDGAKSQSESINDNATNLSALESSSSQSTINKDDESEKDEPAVEKREIEVDPPKKAAVTRKTPTTSAKRDLSTSLNDTAPLIEVKNSKGPETETSSAEFKTPKKTTPRKRAPTAAAKRKLDVSLNVGASSLETINLNKTAEDESKIVENNTNTPETKTPKMVVAKRKTPTTAAQRKKVIPGSTEPTNAVLEETKNSSLSDEKEKALESEISFTNGGEAKTAKKATPNPKSNKDSAAKKTPAKRKKISVDTVVPNQLEALNKASSDDIRDAEEEMVQSVTIQSTNIKAITPKKDTVNSKAKKSTPLTATKRKNSVIGNSNSGIKDGPHTYDSDSDCKVETKKSREVAPKQIKSILKKSTPGKFEIKFETKMNLGKKEAQERNTDDLVASLINGGPLIQKTKKSKQNDSNIIPAKPKAEDQETALIDIGSLFEQFERPNLLESYDKGSDSNSKIEDHTATKDTSYKPEEESTVQETSAKKNKPATAAKPKRSFENPEESSLIDMGSLFEQTHDSPKKAVKRKKLNEESEKHFDVDSELNETQESQVNYTIEEEEKSQDDNGDSSSGAKKKKKRKIELQNNISNSHDKLSLICPQPDCSKTFTSHAHLSKHLTTKHPHVKQHTCVICGKMFALISELRAHMDKRHMGEMLSCANCAASFRSQKKYEAHVFSEKCKNAVHPCQYCERQFVVPSKLHLHVLKKHPSAVAEDDDVLD